jgi:Outer membrane protein beta-barrel domain
MTKLKRFQNFKPGVKKSALLLLLVLSPMILNGQQRLSLGIHADPLLSWFTSDNSRITNNGARAGFSFGLTVNKYFSPNYSFSTGITLMRAGGSLRSKDTTVLELSKSKYTVLPGNPVNYKIQYLVFPVGLKLQTNQIGYLTFFTDLGLDPKIVIGRKADIPSLNVTGEKAANELRLFNLSYHVTAGIEYSLGGSTALVAGLNFDNNFLDITKDTGEADKVSNKILSFRLGINF